MEDLITINVGGKLFTTRRTTLCQKPDTLLGRLYSNESLSEFHSGEALFFDRSPEMFEAILSWYRTGLLVKPLSVPDLLWANELEYYGIFNILSEIYDPIYEQVKKSIQEDVMNLFKNPQGSIFLKFKQFILSDKQLQDALRGPEGKEGKMGRR